MLYSRKLAQGVIGGLVLPFLFLHSASSYAQESELSELRQSIQMACPKQWEGLYTDIELNPNVLDIWQGDLTDKAQFVQYANEVDHNGKARLLDEAGNLLIDSYNDVVTIMTECAAQRVTYYKTTRQQTGASVNGMVNMLTGQTAFGRNSIAGGIDYQSWIDGSETVEDIEEMESVNLAIGRNTTQSGTSSDELSNTETELSEEEYGTLAQAQGYAVKAVDNDVNGNFADGSVTHTGTQNQPYWEIDLDDVSLIESINIYSRTDCCAELLSNFSILIGSRPIDARRLEDAKALDGVTAVVENKSFNDGDHLYTESDIADSVKDGMAVKARLTAWSTFTMPENTQGRYVRIQLAGAETVLSLAEVQIIGKKIKKRL